MSDTDITYDEFRAWMAPYILQISPEAANDRLRDAVIEFCRESNVLTQEVKAERMAYHRVGVDSDTSSTLSEEDRALGYSDPVGEGLSIVAESYEYVLDPGGYQLDRILDAQTLSDGMWNSLEQGFYSNQVTGGGNLVKVIVYSGRAPANVWFTFSKAPMRTSTGFPQALAEIYKEALIAKAAVLFGDQFIRKDRDWGMYYRSQLAKALESSAARSQEPLGLINGELPYPYSRYY